MLENLDVAKVLIEAFDNDETGILLYDKKDKIFHKCSQIKHLSNKYSNTKSWFGNIKITDVTGNLVAEAQSNTNLRFKGYNLEIDGGTAYWNGKNLANRKVASGVYVVLISDLENLETKVLKIMLIRQ